MVVVKVVVVVVIVVVIVAVEVVVEVVGVVVVFFFRTIYSQKLLYSSKLWLEILLGSMIASLSIFK